MLRFIRNKIISHPLHHYKTRKKINRYIIKSAIRLLSIDFVALYIKQESPYVGVIFNGPPIWLLPQIQINLTFYQRYMYSLLETCSPRLTVPLSNPYMDALTFQSYFLFFFSFYFTVIEVDFFDSLSVDHVWVL